MNRFLIVLLVTLLPVFMHGCGGHDPGCSGSGIHKTSECPAPLPVGPDQPSAAEIPEPALHNGFSSAPAAGLPESPLTLVQAIDMAIRNNPGLHQAVCRTQQARAMKALSDAAFWPAVGVYTEYMQGDAPSAFLFKTIDQRRMPSNANFNDPGWFENFETGVTARMNLFNGGRDYLNRRMAQQDVRVSALERQAVTNALTAQVIAAFYDVLSARAFVDIAAAGVATASEQLRIITVQYEGGGALKSDMLSLKVRLARAEENLVTTRNRYQLATAALVHLMGLDPALDGADLTLAAPAVPRESFLPEDMAVFENTDPMAGLAVPPTCESGILYALEHRPELEKVQELLAKSVMGRNLSKTGYLPRIDVMGKYYVDDPRMAYHHDRDNWTAALMFNWDLFSGFATRAHIRKADAVLKEMKAADREAVLNVKLDVKNAWLNLAAARARYAVAASSVESAEASFQLVKAHYQGGAVTITRYLAAELDRDQARIRAAAAFYDQIKAKAELARATGMLADRTSVGPIP